MDKPRFAGLRWPGSTRVVVLGQGLAIIILAIRIWQSRIRQSSTLRFSLGFVVVKSHRTKPDGHCRKIAIRLIDRVNEWLDYWLLKCACPMTKAEKNRLSTVIRATEYLFLENIALKLVLEHRAVPNWQRLLERLLDDKEMLAGVRLKFRDLYGQLAGTADPSGALDALLAELPAPKKLH